MTWRLGTLQVTAFKVSIVKVSIVYVACVFVATACSIKRVAGENVSATPCILSAVTRQELESCLDRQLRSVFEKVDAAGGKVVRNFPGEPDMAALVRIAKEGWQGYLDTYCGLVGAVAAGGQARGELPLDARRKYAACLVRVSEEFEAALLSIATVAPGDQK
jgi:hypothetical protein